MRLVIKRMSRVYKALHETGLITFFWVSHQVEHPNDSSGEKVERPGNVSPDEWELYVRARDLLFPIADLYNGLSTSATKEVFKQVFENARISQVGLRNANYFFGDGDEKTRNDPAYKQRIQTALEMLGANHHERE